MCFRCIHTKKIIQCHKNILYANFFCWLEMWTLWRCVSNWRGLHHPNMPKDWLCGWLHGRRSSPLGDGSQGCSPGGSQLCPGTQDRFSLFYEAPRIDVGRDGRASAHLQAGSQAELTRTISSPGPCLVLPGDSSHCSQPAHIGVKLRGLDSANQAREENNVSLRWYWHIRMKMGWNWEISLHLTLCTGTELTWLDDA